MSGFQVSSCDKEDGVVHGCFADSGKVSYLSAESSLSVDVKKIGCDVFGTGCLTGISFSDLPDNRRNKPNGNWVAPLQISSETVLSFKSKFLHSQCFEAICDIGSASFKYDMRRLTEILALPKAWYRRTLARRLFLGEEMTGDILSDSGKRADHSVGKTAVLCFHIFFLRAEKYEISNQPGTTISCLAPKHTFYFARSISSVLSRDPQAGTSKMPPQDHEFVISGSVLRRKL